MTTEMPFKSNDFPPHGQARPDVASTALAGLSTDDGAAGGSEQVIRDTLARLRGEGPDQNWTIVQRVDDTDPVVTATAIGVSTTRRSPNFSRKPLVTLNAPPN